MGTLTDVDECSKADPKNASGPGCSQMCVNTFGSYYCSCYSGYTLQPDHQTCLCEYSVHHKAVMLKRAITFPS